LILSESLSFLFLFNKEAEKRKEKNEKKREKKEKKKRRNKTKREKEKRGKEEKLLKKSKEKKEEEKSLKYHACHADFKTGSCRTGKPKRLYTKVATSRIQTLISKSLWKKNLMER
jgi:hypothetical protein